MGRAYISYVMPPLQRYDIMENYIIRHIVIGFFETSPVPSYPEEGLHRFPLNPLSPQGTGDLKPGRPGLYSQTSARPKGLLVVFDAIELRLFDEQSWRVFMRRGHHSG